MRLPLVLVASAGSLLAAHVLGWDEQTMLLVYLSCFGIALSAVSGVTLGALQGLQQMRSLASAGVLAKVLTLGLAGFVVARDLGLLALVVAGLAAATVGGVWNVIDLVRGGGIGGRIDLSRWRPILLASMPFFIWQSALLVYGQIDILLLSVLSTEAAIGWYAAAYRIISIPAFVPTIICGALFPALSWAARHDAAEFGRLARRGMNNVLILTLPMALGTIAIAAQLVDFLQLSSGFRNAVPLIVVLALHIPMVAASMVVGYVLNARSQQRTWALVAVGAAVLNPGLNWLLIPYFESTMANGAIGAAVGTVLTEMFMLGAGLWLARSVGFNRSNVGFALRCLIASLVMVGAVLLLVGLPLPLTVALGGAVYLVLSFALGTVSVRDLQQVRAFVLRRRGAD
jgi:O-antigen/teichoic acid export membrane protein